MKFLFNSKNDPPEVVRKFEQDMIGIRWESGRSISSYLACFGLASFHSTSVRDPPIQFKFSAIHYKACPKVCTKFEYNRLNTTEDVDLMAVTVLTGVSYLNAHGPQYWDFDEYPTYAFSLTLLQTRSECLVQLLQTSMTAPSTLPRSFLSWKCGKRLTIISWTTTRNY